MMALLANWRVFAALGVVAAFIGVYQYGKMVQRQSTAVNNANAVVKAIENRSKIDGSVKDADAVAICVDLGGVRDECSNGLRRVD